MSALIETTSAEYNNKNNDLVFLMLAAEFLNPSNRVVHLANEDAKLRGCCRTDRESNRLLVIVLASARFNESQMVCSSRI